MDILKLSDWLVKGALLFPQLVAQVGGKTHVQPEQAWTEEMRHGIGIDTF